jgi:hypothetical protein
MDSKHCFPDLKNLKESVLQCNFIKLLPNGILWDAQKDDYFSQNYSKNTTNMVYVAVFFGSALYHTLTGIVDKLLREYDPNEAVDELDAWLERLGWDYKNISYDFSPDGLFKRVEKNGDLVRGKEDYTEYAIALKSAIVFILDKALLLPNRMNLETLNNLLKHLSLEMFYSIKQEKDYFLGNGFYLKLTKPSVIIENGKTLPIKKVKGLDLKPLIFEIGDKIIQMFIKKRLIKLDVDNN